MSELKVEYKPVFTHKLHSFITVLFHDFEVFSSQRISVIEVVLPHGR